MKKTLIACVCQTLVCIATEAHQDQSGFHSFDPDAKYVAWKHYGIAKKCDLCPTVFEYFVNKSGNPPKNFKTFQVDA